MLLDHCGPVVTLTNEFDPQALAVTVFTSIFDVDDPFEREAIIYDSIYEKALIAQGIKACSDTRAFMAFSESRDKHLELKRKRSQNSLRSVTPTQSAWASGQVYANDAPAQPAERFTGFDDVEFSGDRDTASNPKQ